MVAQSKKGIDLFDATIQDIQIGDFVWLGHETIVRPQLRGRVLVINEENLVLHFNPCSPDDFWEPDSSNPRIENPNSEQKVIELASITFVKIVYAVTISRERKWRLG
jgi:hypothetical protein